jgi:signal peptide peptidase SppA
MRYPAIAARFYTSLWAIRPEDHHFISELILRRSAGESVTPEQIRAAIEGKAYGSPFAPPAGDVAVIGLHGTIMNRAGLMTVSGFTSPQDFAAAVRAAAADASVREIVLSVDSPGGTVDGTNTAAEAVRDAAKVKPVTAVADGMMASGAYWISSQATRVVVDPTALVGSIGVIATHLDRTKEAEDAGVRVSYFRSVEHKALGQPYEPLTEAAGDGLRATVTAAHAQFVSAIERQRGPLSKAAATGRVFTGLEAVEAGLADEVGTLHSVLDGIVRGRQGGARGTRAASAAGRTTVDFEAIRTALGLAPDATTEDATSAIAALASARDEAQAAHEKAREAALHYRAELRDAHVRAVVRDARLPSVNADSDQRFLDACLAAARATDDTAEASAAVEALIADRRELLAGQGATTKSAPPTGDTSAAAATIESREITRARAGLDL